MNNEPTFRIIRKSSAPSLLKRRAWFDGEGTPPPPPPPADDTSGAGGKPPDKPADKPPIKTFSQEELDAIVGNRSKESRQAAINELLKELGEENLDGLKAKHKAAKDAEEAALSEQQKLTKRAETAEVKAQELEQKLKDEQAARLRDKLQNDVLIAASNAKSQHPEDVWQWLNANAAEDLAKAINDKGEVDKKVVEGLVGKAKDARPSWFEAQRKVPGSPSNSGGKVPEPGKEKEQAAAARQRASIRRSF